jgi:hypothetical protein
VDVRFVILISSNVFQRLRVSLLMPWGPISVKFFQLLLTLICWHVLHVFNHAITSAVFPSMWKVAIIRPVAQVGTPSGPYEFMFYLRRLHAFSMISWSMLMVEICSRIFSLVSNMRIAPRLFWSGLPRSRYMFS